MIAEKNSVIDASRLGRRMLLLRLGNQSCGVSLRTTRTSSCPSEWNSSPVAVMASVMGWDGFRCVLSATNPVEDNVSLTYSRSASTLGSILCVEDLEALIAFESDVVRGRYAPDRTPVQFERRLPQAQMMT